MALHEPSRWERGRQSYEALRPPPADDHTQLLFSREAIEDEDGDHILSYELPLLSTSSDPASAPSDTHPPSPVHWSSQTYSTRNRHPSIWSRLYDTLSSHSHRLYTLIMDTGYPRRKSSVVQVENRDDGVLRVNDEHIRRMSVIDPNVASQNADAKAATDREHRMTVREAFRLYPKAIAFSLIFSTAIIMEGYDTALLGTFYGFLP